MELDILQMLKDGSYRKHFPTLQSVTSYIESHPLDDESQMLLLEHSSHGNPEEKHFAWELLRKHVENHPLCDRVQMALLDRHAHGSHEEKVFAWEILNKHIKNYPLGEDVQRKIKEMKDNGSVDEKKTANLIISNYDRADFVWNKFHSSVR